MRFCVSCGHELGVGRFCTNCGHPIGRPVDPPATDEDWRTDTAQRPAAPATPPPPPPPRYPLFADEVEEQPTASYAAVDLASPATHRRRRRPWGLWAAAALALVVVAGLGIWLLSDEEPDGPGAQHPAASTPPSSASPSEESPSVDPAAVTVDASVEVPRTAPPGRDVSGNPVDYEGANLLDGIPETTWRMPGDGTGQELVITLAAETRLRSVGLINGYAKTARDAQGRELDWYHGNRRVTSVEWVFDDGTTVTQDLEDTTAVQSVDVDVTTTTLTLRLVGVSAAGTGRAARNYTAISDVSLVGAG
jgi:hypothetical protein